MKSKKYGFAIRRIIWIAVWLISLVTISFYGGPVSYAFFYAVTLLPILSFLYLLVVFGLFRVHQELDTRILMCGQPTPYRFILRNEGFYPFVSVSVTLHSFFSKVENMKEDTEYELLRGDEHELETNLICNYRGEYEVGIKEVIVTDFLRLFRFKYRIGDSIKTFVNPRLTHMEYLNGIDEFVNILQKDSQMHDTEPDVLVRDYAEGDSLRQISWKVSAREQSLKVRKRIGEEKHGVILFADTKRYSGEIRKYIPLESKMLEVMAALGLYLAEHDMGYTACWKQDVMVCKQVARLGSFEDFYDGISRIAFQPENDLTESLKALAKQGVLWDARIIVSIVHEMSEEVYSMLSKMAEQGSLVVIYVVTDQNCDDYAARSNSRMKIIAVGTEDKLEGLL